MHSVREKGSIIVDVSFHQKSLTPTILTSICKQNQKTNLKKTKKTRKCSNAYWSLKEQMDLEEINIQ